MAFITYSIQSELEGDKKFILSAISGKDNKPTMPSLEIFINDKQKEYSDNEEYLVSFYKKLIRYGVLKDENIFDKEEIQFIDLKEESGELLRMFHKSISLGFFKGKLF